MLRSLMGSRKRSHPEQDEPDEPDEPLIDFPTRRLKIFRKDHPQLDPRHFSRGLVAQSERESFHIQDLSAVLVEVANLNMWEKLTARQMRLLQMPFPNFRKDEAFALKIIAECEYILSSSLSSLSFRAGNHPPT